MRNLIIAIPDKDVVMMKKDGWIARKNGRIALDLSIDEFIDPLEVWKKKEPEKKGE